MKKLIPKLGASLCFSNLINPLLHSSPRSKISGASVNNKYLDFRFNPELILMKQKLTNPDTIELSFLPQNSHHK